MSVPGPAPPLVIANVRVIASPEADPIENATVVLREGRIEYAGADRPSPSGVPVLDGHGGTVVAGFWNAHVHFTEPKWATLSRRSPQWVNEQLAEMLTSRGFTTVVDCGSDYRHTLPLRDRIQRGDLLGPRIYTAGSPLYPPAGIPYYVRDSIPWYLRWALPKPATPAAAARAVRRSLRRGMDVVKLFTGSYVDRGKVLPMDEAVARAAVGAAHQEGRLVFAHPSDREGVRVAVRAGVDVLAHAPDATEGVDDALLAEAAERKMVMTPTLKMFATTVTTDPAYLAPIYDVVRRFRGAGGRLMFGTDVGYMSDYSTLGEFEGLCQCGVEWREALRMLTVTPCALFGAADRGTVAPGMVADLVVLGSDPAKDLAEFSNVRATIRAGRVLWRTAG